MIDGVAATHPASVRALARAPALARATPWFTTKMLTHFNNITLRCERLFI